MSNEVFEIKRRKLTVKTESGGEYQMTFPSALRAKQMQKELTESDPIKVIDLIQGYFVECGLPQAVLDQDMDMSNLEGLWTVLVTGKKN